MTPNHSASGCHRSIHHLQASVNLTTATLTSLEEASALQAKFLSDLKQQMEDIHRTNEGYNKDLNNIQSSLSMLPDLQVAISELEKQMNEQKEVIRSILLQKIQAAAQNNIQ